MKIRFAIGFLGAVMAACGAGKTAFVSGTANGTLGSWSATTSLPHGLANHCAVTIGDRIVVAGGNWKPGDAFEDVDEIWAAPVKDDGTLGAWELAGSLPSAASAVTCAADGKRLIVLGGLWANASHQTKVWAAELGDEFVEIGELPETILSSEAWVRNGELIVVDSEIPDEGDATFALIAPLATMQWRRVEIDARFRGYPAAAFDGERVFVAGGYLGADQQNAATDAVRIASLDGTAIDGRVLPEAVTSARAIAIDGHLFVIGGKPQPFGAAIDAAWSAPIGAELGEWKALADLPEARSNFSMTVAKDHVFVIGGGNSGPGVEDVFTARIRW